jgi:hypothetical protein
MEDGLQRETDFSIPKTENDFFLMNFKTRKVTPEAKLPA